MDREDNAKALRRRGDQDFITGWNERNDPRRGLKASVRPTRPGVRPRSATALRIQDSAEDAEPTQCVFRPRLTSGGGRS
jgi:hypothetical protein